MKKYIYITLAAPLLAALSACNGNADKADAYGNFEADEITVSAEASGKIIYFKAVEGTMLKSGEEVGLIDTVQLYLRKKQLEASLNAIRKKLPNEAAQLAVFDERIEKLNKEVSRLEKLVAANAAPSKQLDDLRAELEVTKRQRAATASTLGTQTQGMLAELEPMHFQLLQIEDQLAKSHIVNPIDGTVLTKMVNESEMTGAGRPLYQIASLNPLILKAYVSEDMLTQFKIGDEVSVKTDAENGEMTTHSGKVTWVSSEAEFTPKIIQTRDERTTQVYAIKIDVENDGSLKIGMPGEVYFNSTSEE